MFERDSAEENDLGADGDESSENLPVLVSKAEGSRKPPSAVFERDDLESDANGGGEATRKLPLVVSERDDLDSNAAEDDEDDEDDLDSDADEDDLDSNADEEDGLNSGTDGDKDDLDLDSDDEGDEVGRLVSRRRSVNSAISCRMPSLAILS